MGTKYTLVNEGMEGPDSGLVVRVSALKLGGRGSIPGRVIPKTVKMGPNAALLGTQHQWVGLGVKSTNQLIPERGSCCGSPLQEMGQMRRTNLAAAIAVTNSATLTLIKGQSRGL